MLFFWRGLLASCKSLSVSVNAMSDQEIFCQSCGSVMPKTAPEELCPRCTIGILIGDEGGEPKLETAPEIPGVTIHQEVGEGGFGIVYRATETGVVRRRVALKVLKPGVDTRQVLRRFQVEQQALALLEHPNIARIYQAGETSGGYPYFTMEFIEGVPITEFFVTSEISPLLEVFRLVCAAVAFANQKGVIHRDLKPSNVLVTAEGAPKVIDFGVAKATDPENTPGMTFFTGSEGGVGTPGYMAPEQVDSNEIEIDARTDVYALGAILYEILTGVTPLDAAVGEPLSPKKAREVLGEIEIPCPSEIALREIPPELDWIVLKALEVEPDKRYDTASDFEQDLRKFLAGDPPKAGVPTKLNRNRWRLQMKWMVAVFLVGMVWILVGFFTSDELLDVGKEEPEPLVAFRHDSSGIPHSLQVQEIGDSSKALAVFREGGSSLLVDLTTGENLGVIPMFNRTVRCTAFGSEGNRFLVGYDNGFMGWHSSHDGRPLTSPWIVTTGKGPVDLIHHFHSPVHEQSIICTASGDLKFKAWSDGGELLWEVPLVHPPYLSSMSPDYSLALVGSLEGAINVIDVVGKSRRSVIDAHSSRISDLAFSNSGSHFASASYDGRACVWSADGSLAQTFEHSDLCLDVEFSPDGNTIATACRDGFARIWNVQSGEELQKFRHSNHVHAIAISPDGKTLASGGRGKTIRYWSLETGEPLRDPVSLDNLVCKLRFTREGHLLALTWERSLRFFPRTEG